MPHISIGISNLWSGQWKVDRCIESGIIIHPEPGCCRIYFLFANVGVVLWIESRRSRKERMDRAWQRVQQMLDASAQAKKAE